MQMHLFQKTICENKAADQLCYNLTDDQRLCFRPIDSTIHLSKSEISADQRLCFCPKDSTIHLSKFEISSFYLFFWLSSPVCVEPGG